jgi:hypothetical protein
MKFVIRLTAARYRNAQKVPNTYESAMVRRLPSAVEPERYCRLAVRRQHRQHDHQRRLQISVCQHRFVITHTKHDFEFVCERCRHRTEELPPVRLRTRRGAHVIPFSGSSSGSGVAHPIHR